MAANGGNPVQLHAPGTFTSGSSSSHLDDSISGVMNFSVAPGVQKRTYADVEIGILQDIGWSVAAVPEVSGVLVLIPLLGSPLCYHRRRRRVALV